MFQPWSLEIWASYHATGPSKGWCELIIIRVSPSEVLLELRAKAKQEKDWPTADLIRDELKKLNIEVKDSSEGSCWEIKEN